MMRLAFFTLSILLMTQPVQSAPKNMSPSQRLADFQKRAARFKSVVTIPVFETTTNALTQATQGAIDHANGALDRIAALNPRKVTFRNTVLALDDLTYDVGCVGNRLSLIKETSPDAAMRETATEASKTLSEW